MNIVGTKSALTNQALQAQELQLEPTDKEIDDVMKELTPEHLALARECASYIIQKKITATLDTER